jgi:glutamine synthetase
VNPLTQVREDLQELEAADMQDKTEAASAHDELKKFVAEHNITTFKVGVVDLEGVWRGKRIAAQYFLESVYERGTNICNIIFGWDIQDELIPNLTYTGWETGYPDVTLLPDLKTLKAVPGEPGVASVICDMYELSGEPSAICPRGILKRVVEKAESMGYSPVCAYEFEFYLFKGTPNELAANDWRQLEPITAGSHTYSLYRDTGTEFLIGEIRRRLLEQGISIEASNSENGPGQFEMNIHYSDALAAADNAVRLKTTVKEVAAAAGYTASFMAKINPDWAGSSGHMHQSLWDPATGASVFANAENPGELSELGYNYLAGVVETAPELTALYLPTVNSYKRTEGGAWAGSSASWGLDNRTVAIRSIPAKGNAARIENRVPGADANPYLVIAANIAAGLHGVTNHLVAPARVEGNAYALKEDEVKMLPGTLDKAIDEFSQSEIARTYFGEAFVTHYVQTRRWELHKLQTTVTDWEIARYLERI